MGFNDVANVVAQLGFPIALAIWLLVKDSKQSEKAQQQWNEIKIVLQHQTEIINDIGAFIKYGVKKENQDKDQKS